MTTRSRRFLLLVLLCLAAVPAEAHHMVGGNLPAGFGEGFLSGLAHPVIGLDHLLALVAVALLASGPKAPAAFVLASLVGVALPVAGVVGFTRESLVDVSVAAVGAFLLFGHRRDDATATVGAAAIGALHGLAYAEAIVGAEPTPLAAYLAGIGLVELVIVGALGWGARLALRSGSLRTGWAHRAPGAAIAAAGLVLVWLG